MSYSQPARKSKHRTHPTVLALLVVVSLIGILGCRSLTDSSGASPSVADSSGASPSVAASSAHPSRARPRGDVPAGPPGQPQQGEHHRGLGIADGEVPKGVTVFDGKYPAVAKLDPALLSALRKAATDAGGDGVEFYVNSGWRSSVYQKQLLDEAASKYGSRAKAARWVATPTTSPHVSGDAVDIGHSDGTTWLSDHGADYGLCQIYRNEPWHYELRLRAVHHGCPPMYADPTRDPRVQR
jgi:zinc D-Ala-D-Ala carboxypeptidase